MRYPAVFVNHGGGPLPLMGRQENLARHMREITEKWLPPDEPPKSIVILSAHWESDPIKITSSPNPGMYYDYGGFPPETYRYKYPAPGSPELAKTIQGLLGERAGLESKLDGERGFDHGVFVPLMLMYPDANVPVVCVSLHESLDAEINMKIGEALSPLRDDGVLILGSGYTFHNMQAFFHPSNKTYQASQVFNEWLKETLLNTGSGADDHTMLAKLKDWEKAPGARMCHPREEHLLPLLMTAATKTPTERAKLIFDVNFKDNGENHAISGYLFS